MSSGEYQCKKCGKCCQLEIPLTLLDIHRIAKFLKISDEKIFENFVQEKLITKTSLFKICENEQNECLFLDSDNTCSIHNSKPRACSIFSCQEISGKETTCYSYNYSANSNANALVWEQSLAATITKAYAEKNGHSWNTVDYYKAIVAIYDNIVVSERQKIKLARNYSGAPLGMIYDCSQCDKPGSYAKETPITLDDIQRIIGHLKLDFETFFAGKISPHPSCSTGTLQLIRKERCVFFDEHQHCTIKDVRPMHCCFTPCPRRIENENDHTCFFYGSGTLKEQFRHHIALELTSQYVKEFGVKCNSQGIDEKLRQLEKTLSDSEQYNQFCTRVQQYRYIDDSHKIVVS